MTGQPRPAMEVVMDLGTLLVLLGIVLAVVSFLVANYSARLLTAAVIVGFVGVLVGDAALSV